MPAWLTRTLLAPLLILGVFFLYAYGLDLLSALIDLSAMKRYYQSQDLAKEWVQVLVLLGVIVPHFLLVACLSYVFSLAAVKAYGKHAIWIAVLAALPVVAIRASELFDETAFETYSSKVSYANAVYEISSFVILLCLGTWLSAHRLAAPPTPQALRA